MSDGGPSPRDAVRLLRAHASDPDSDTRRFLDALIYNWAIAAPDAHAKNYSVALAGDRVALAPMYDVISQAVSIAAAQSAAASQDSR